MIAARCPTCDRSNCPMQQDHRHHDLSRYKCPGCVAIDDCNAHRVDWRARALVAESLAAEASGRTVEEYTKPIGDKAERVAERVAEFKAQEERRIRG